MSILNCGKQENGVHGEDGSIIEEVIGDIDTLVNGSVQEYDEEDDIEDPPYERSIVIEFPPECSLYPGAQSLEVSIRDVLSWYSEVAPEGQRQRAGEIRDVFYSGDDRGDYATGFLHMDAPYEEEERALQRWELAQHHADRVHRKRKLDEEVQQDEALEERLWGPFLAEKAVLQAEREALWDGADALEEEWYDFVCHYKTVTGVTDDWIAQRRSQLKLKSRQLGLEQDRNAEARYDLRRGAGEALLALDPSCVIPIGAGRF